jgi:broad specificity phosphatase PhoE
LTPPLTRYWFVRHGESEANAGGWLAGHRDVGLTEQGVAQAHALRPLLAEVRPERVWTSDLARTLMTARLAWHHRLPPAQVAPAVRERHLGEWEGVSIAELLGSDGMEVLLSWDQGPPGGESHALLARRALSFLAQQEDGRPTLIFSHGGWIRTVLGVLDGTPFDQIGKFKIANTELHVRDVAPGTWQRLLQCLGT